MDKLYIPKKIKLGFNIRDNTYTKKLAYIIYYDHNNVLRKEYSWENWRDKKISPEDYDNVPTDGFVLNKSGGGSRESYGWNPRNEFIRVYDPRGFEFEISVANLLFILKESDCNRGKGLEGKFVYSWDRDKLVLLPVSSEMYVKSNKYTELQKKSNVPVKNLVPGKIYNTKKYEKLIYIGRLDYKEYNYTVTSVPSTVYKGKIFYKRRQLVTKNNLIFKSEDGTYLPLNNSKSIAEEIGELDNSAYTESLLEYKSSANFSSINKFSIFNIKDRVENFVSKDVPVNNVYEKRNVYWRVSGEDDNLIDKFKVLTYNGIKILKKINQFIILNKEIFTLYSEDNSNDFSEYSCEFYLKNTDWFNRRYTKYSPRNSLLYFPENVPSDIITKVIDAGYNIDSENYDIIKYGGDLAIELESGNTIEHTYFTY